MPQTVQAEAVETEGEVALGHLAALACDVCCFSLSCTWSWSYLFMLRWWATWTRSSSRSASDCGGRGCPSGTWRSSWSSCCTCLWCLCPYVLLCWCHAAVHFEMKATCHVCLSLRWYYACNSKGFCFPWRHHGNTTVCSTKLVFIPCAITLPWYVFLWQWLLMIWGQDELHGTETSGANGNEDPLKDFSGMTLKLFGMLK